MMFPLEKILFALSSDSKATRYVLESIKPKVLRAKSDFMAYLIFWYDALD